jgi:hypothetical protein
LSYKFSSYVCKDSQIGYISDAPSKSFSSEASKTTVDVSDVFAPNPLQLNAV